MGGGGGGEDCTACNNLHVENTGLPVMVVLCLEV